MVIHQEHFGRKFYQDLKTGYWISTDYPRIRAHRWVWINTHGKIPKRYQIHHKNENKSDNRIENLAQIERSEHMRLHITEEKKALLRIRSDIIRPLTKEWHASKEGKLWHQLHGIKTWRKKQPIKIECKICHKISETKTYHQEFCSNACKSKWRRDSGIDNVERECVVCKAIFVVNKYSKVRSCSRSCGTSIRWGK